jgi:hypothetical protein
MLLVDEVSSIDTQQLYINEDSSVVARTEPAMQGGGSHNHLDRRQ